MGRIKGRLAGRVGRNAWYGSSVGRVSGRMLRERLDVWGEMVLAGRRALNQSRRTGLMLGLGLVLLKLLLLVLVMMVGRWLRRRWQARVGCIWVILERGRDQWGDNGIV